MARGWPWHKYIEARSRQRARKKEEEHDEVTGKQQHVAEGKHAACRANAMYDLAKSCNGLSSACVVRAAFGSSKLVEVWEVLQLVRSRPLSLRFLGRAGGAITDAQRSD